MLNKRDTLLPEKQYKCIWYDITFFQRRASLTCASSLKRGLIDCARASRVWWYRSETRIHLTSAGDFAPIGYLSTGRGPLRARARGGVLMFSLGS